jgi:hypothetical protein
VEKRGFVIVRGIMHESIMLRSVTSHVFLIYRRQNYGRASPNLVVGAAARYFASELEDDTCVCVAAPTHLVLRRGTKEAATQSRTGKPLQENALTLNL